MRKRLPPYFLIGAVLLGTVPALAADGLLTGGAGRLRVEIDLERGGALDGLWFDSNGDGRFEASERWIDSPDRSDLVFITRRVPVDSLVEPLGVYLPGSSFRQTALVDSAYIEEGDGWTAVIEGHFGWAGRWPYHLVWRVPAEGTSLRASMSLGDDVRLIGASSSQGPFADIEVRDLIVAWGIGLRLHYADRESYHVRTFFTRIDDALVRVPAEELRWSQWANQRWLRSRSSKEAEISPWPDFNLVSLAQTGAGGGGALVWKAVEPTVGHLNVRRGGKSGGWTAVGDGARGIGIAMSGLGTGEAGEMRADLDFGDRTGLVNCYFQSPGMRPIDPFIHENQVFNRTRELVIVPFAGRFEDSGLERSLGDRSGGRKGGAD